MKNIVYNIDNMEFMKTIPDKYYELAIVDPPFPVITSGGGEYRKLMRQKNWDKSIPDKKYFKELFRISENQIIWGGNYFTNYLNQNNNWIVWHKNVSGVNFSECELAWSSIRKNIRLYKEMIMNNTLKWHACPKPVKLYKWLLTNYAKLNDKIFDSHVGSGSIRIACHELGFDFTGCELDKDYWQAQEKRYKEWLKKYNNEFYIGEENDLFKGIE